MIVFECNISKFRRITRPRFAIRKKLAIRVLMGVKYQAKSGAKNRAFNRASTDHDFGFSNRASTRPRIQTFNKSRVGTPLRWNLNITIDWKLQYAAQNGGINHNNKFESHARFFLKIYQFWVRFVNCAVCPFGDTVAPFKFDLKNKMLSVKRDSHDGKRITLRKTLSVNFFPQI